MKILCSLRDKGLDLPVELQERVFVDQIVNNALALQLQARELLVEGTYTLYLLSHIHRPSLHIRSIFQITS